jgi:hypothetical protein
MERRVIKNAVIQSTERVKESLESVENISIDQARGIIGCYAAAIGPNFVPWMAAAAVSVRSLEARFACEENIYVEIAQNHIGMLDEFAAAAGAVAPSEPTQNASVVRSEIGKMNGLYNLTVVALLEHTSSVFVPWLAILAKLCGSNNLEYTNIHGVADQKHAEQFLWALEHEATLHRGARKIIEHAIVDAERFLQNIFAVK